MTHTILITGCSTGIGRATARHLHDRGHNVVATARDITTLAALAAEGIATATLDVTDEASMQNTVEGIEAEHGAVDVLVNNAGYAVQGAIEEVPLAEVRRQFDTNVFGVVRLTQLVLPAMRAQGSGRIVTVGSMGGRFTLPGGGYYHASKYAIEAIMDALRLEVAPFGIHAILVQPGPVRTAFESTAFAAPAEDAATADGSAYEGFNHALRAAYSNGYAESAASLTLRPEQVATTIAGAIDAKNPRARYAVGTMARALMTTRRVLPDVAWDAALRRAWPTP